MITVLNGLLPTSLERINLHRNMFGSGQSTVLGGGLVQFSGGVSSFLFLSCFFQEVVPVSVFLFFCESLRKQSTV